MFWVVYGFCFEFDSYVYIVQWFDVEVLLFWLIDLCFYYFDICFCFFDGGYFFYYLLVFDIYLNVFIECCVFVDWCIVVFEFDVVYFVCNVVSLGDVIVMNQISSEFENVIFDCGYCVVQMLFIEFFKVGGVVKCLMLCMMELIQGEL